MRLHKQLLSKSFNQAGYTFVEMLVVALIGTLLTTAGIQLILTSLNTSETLEEKNKVRKKWNKTAAFINSEVSQSQGVITNESLINLQQCDDAIASENFRFALKKESNLKPIIYYVQGNESDTKEWEGTTSLWRCGPDIDANGYYISTLSQEILIDGMNTGQSCSLTVQSPTPTEKKGTRISFTLCLIDENATPYSQTVSAYSRVHAIYPIPSNDVVCDPELEINDYTVVDLSGVDTVGTGEPSIICGYGQASTITGSYKNDILETGINNTSSTSSDEDEDEDCDTSNNANNNDPPIICCGSGPPFCTGNPSDRPACCNTDICISDSEPAPEPEPDCDSEDDSENNNSSGVTSAVLNGGYGNDRLVGGPGDDTLNGLGDNPDVTDLDSDEIEELTDDDVLIGNEGDDSMNGGPGDDQYLPGSGDNTINDSGGLDILYLKVNKADINDLEDCIKSDCDLTYTEDGIVSSVSAVGIDVIIFNDKRHDVPD